MKTNRKQNTPTRRTVTKNVRLASVSIVIALIAMVVLSIRTNTEASGSQAANNDSSYVVAKPSPDATPASNAPAQTSATRITIFFGEKQDMQVATGVDSAVAVSPEIATVEIKNRFTLTITPIKRGETILLVTFGGRRQTYIIQVVSPPAAPARTNVVTDKARALAPSGSFTTMFSPQLGSGASVLRQTLDYRQKLANGRTLRVAGEMFRLFGNTDESLAVARVQDFALNRLTVGLDTATRSFDIVDSQVNLSAMSLNNYTMRGFHMSSPSKADPDDNLHAKGLEVFAGLARPSLAFFDTNGGKLAGAMIPVITTDDFQARAGFIAVSADRFSREARGGVIFQTDATYAPSKEIFADGEMSFANGDLSWRTRLDLNYAKYGGSGEVTRFALSSPLNSIGAQYGGRKDETFSFYWRPEHRLSTSAGYNHTSVSRLTNSQLADYDRSLLFSNVSYAVTKALRLNLRYSDQKIETAFPGALSKFAIETRTVSLGNTYRFNSKWSNTIEGRLNFNREANADASLERGFSLNEQLRLGWRGGSLTGFLYYNRKTPSLTSLIVANPGLLPPALQAAFALDPAEFLRLNRDRIAFLLGGIELPQTRSTDAGIRFQKTISRFSISGETRYNAGEIYAVNQKNLYTSASVGIRLDRANAVQLYGWKSLGGTSQSGLTVSYTHQFGAPGDGFQFSKLFNFNRGRVRGRVFYDLNGNGLPDAGEPGVAGMKIQIDGKRSITTDKDGRYELAANEGSHNVALISEDLGVRLLASTPTERRLDMGGGQKVDLNFGVRDAGSISGRVLNDSGSTSQNSGLGGVKVVLRSSDTGSGSFVLEQVTLANGTYDFSDLRPGKYLIEIDPATVPANYRIPGVTTSTIIVDPLHSSYYDVPIAAQRAVTGIVFIDKDGDGRYTFGKDELVEGATVSFKDNAAITDASGSYILRNLPAGRANILVTTPRGVAGSSYVVNLGPEPGTQRAFDLRIEPR